MSTKNIITCFLIAGIIRYLLIISKYAILIRNRIEISTPLNSWKRGTYRGTTSTQPTYNLHYIFSVLEGAYLYNSGINPYIGDMYHENPFVLKVSSLLIAYVPTLIPLLFVGMDLLVGILLYHMAKHFIRQMVNIFLIIISNYLIMPSILFVLV